MATSIAETIAGLERELEQADRKARGLDAANKAGAYAALSSGSAGFVLSVAEATRAKQAADQLRNTLATIRLSDITSIRVGLATAVARHRADIAALEGRLSPPPADGSVEAYVAKVDAVVRDLVRKKGELATLEGHAERARATQAELVATAIEAAGGADAVAVGVQDTRADEAPPNEDVVAKRGQIDALTSRLDRIDKGGSLAATLEAQIGRLRRDVADIREAVTGAARREALALVERAGRGDEQARAEIEATVRRRPEAFAEGLAEALDAAKYEHHVISCVKEQLGSLVQKVG